VSSFLFIHACWASAWSHQDPVPCRGAVSTEQALRVCQCLQHNVKKSRQIINKANSHVHRPVKNRDGGPIAGVAYVNSGGGSRQLGPDDNDPVSATHFPEASNHAIPLPPHNPSTTFTFFSSAITNVTHYTLHTSQIAYFTSTISSIFASNRMSELASIRKRRPLLCLQRRGRICLLRDLSTRFPPSMLRSTAC
jgi:hypothetical protein